MTYISGHREQLILMTSSSAKYKSELLFYQCMPDIMHQKNLKKSPFLTFLESIVVHATQLITGVAYFPIFY